MHLHNPHAISTFVVREGMVANIKDTDGEERFSEPFCTSVAMGMPPPHDEIPKTVLCVPIFAPNDGIISSGDACGEDVSTSSGLGQSVIGFIEACGKLEDSESGFFSEEDEDNLRYLAGIVSLVMHRHGKVSSTERLRAMLMRITSKRESAQEEEKALKERKEKLKKQAIAMMTRMDTKRRSSQIMARASSKRLISMSTFSKKAKAEAVATEEKRRVAERERRHSRLEMGMDKLEKQKRQSMRRVTEEKRLQEANSDWAKPLRLNRTTGSILVDHISFADLGLKALKAQHGEGDADEERAHNPERAKELMKLVSFTAGSKSESGVNDIGDVLAGLKLRNVSGGTGGGGKGDGGGGVAVAAAAGCGGHHLEDGGDDDDSDGDLENEEYVFKVENENEELAV